MASVFQCIVLLTSQPFIDSMKLLYVLWFNFSLGSNFVFLCFKLIIIHYNTQKGKEIKFEPRIELNHNICKACHEIFFPL